MLKIPNHESRRNEGVWQAAVGPFICQMLRGNQPPCMLPVERGLLAVNKSPDSSWQAATRKGLVKADKSMLYRVLLTNAPSEQKSETMDSLAQGRSNHWAGRRWSPGARARRGPMIGCVVDWQVIGSTDRQTGVLKYLVSEIFGDAGRSIHEYLLVMHRSWFFVADSDTDFFRANWPIPIPIPIFFPLSNQQEIMKDSNTNKVFI